MGYLDFNASEVPLAVLLNVRDHIRYTFVLEGAEFPEHGIVPATGFAHIDWAGLIQHGVKSPKGSRRNAKSM